MTQAHEIRAVLVLLLTLFLAACGQEGKWVEVETGYRGEARRNPFLAAEELLDTYSREATTTHSLTEVRASRPAMLITPASSIDDRASVSLLRQEVASGTHLCLLMEDGEIWINDWLNDLDRTEYELADNGALSEWLSELGIELQQLEDPLGHTSTHMEDWVYQLDQPSKLELSIPNPPEIDVIESSSGAMISRPWHEGRVTVLASAAPWRNPNLAERDHAALLLDLSDYYTPLEGSALVLLRNDVSLWELLWKHGWPSILAVAFALLLFLWWHMPRREPIRRLLEAGDRATFRDQIIGTGTYLWQRGNPDTLLGAMRRLATRRWRERNPLRQVSLNTDGALSGEEIKALASWLGEEPAIVQAALIDPAPRKARELELRISRLQHILSALS